MEPQKHTLRPIVTGATVLGIKYNEGVLMVADTLASYGSQARYKKITRMQKIGKYSLLGASGEMSDFQYLGHLLDELDDDDFLAEDGCHMGPSEYASYIGRVMYNRRSKMNPLYNQFVVVGKKKDEAPFLAFADHQGTYYEEDYIATGFGTYLAMPILRNEWRPDITLDEARAMAVKCMQVCFYRDCQGSPEIQMGVCTPGGVSIEPPMKIDHKWNYTAWTKNMLTTGLATGDTW